MNDKMKMIYDLSLDFLYKNKPNSLTDKDLEKYFSVTKEFKSLNDVYERLLETLQNYQGKDNIIGFNKNKEQFKKILFGFDCNKVLNNYNNPEELLNTFSKEFSLGERYITNKKDTWVKYSKSVISGAQFLSQFKNYDEFDSFVRTFSKTEMTSVALPLLLKEEIFGIAFALGCDFLKELGYDQYPKPDTHLIDVFSSLDLSDDKDLNCYKAIIKMAKTTNNTPYKVDKVFWLICSGKYYLDDIEIKGKKKELIDYLKENINETK